MSHDNYLEVVCEIRRLQPQCWNRLPHLQCSTPSKSKFLCGDTTGSSSQKERIWRQFQKQKAIYRNYNFAFKTAVSSCKGENEMNLIWNSNRSLHHKSRLWLIPGYRGWGVLSYIDFKVLVWNEVKKMYLRKRIISLIDLFFSSISNQTKKRE